MDFYGNLNKNRMINKLGAVGTESYYEEITKIISENDSK